MFSFLKANGEGENGGKGKLWMILIASVLGITLILFGSGATTKKSEEKEAPENTSSNDLLLYQEQVEGRIKALCESVAGVSNVTVAITLSGGFESVYATEYPDGYEKYVILGSGSSANALYLTYAAPSITGIGVVCKGGGKDTVRQELLSLLSATCHINSNRIYITEAKNGG